MKVGPAANQKSVFAAAEIGRNDLIFGGAFSGTVTGSSGRNASMAFSITPAIAQAAQERTRWSLSTDSARSTFILYRGIRMTALIDADLGVLKICIWLILWFNTIQLDG